MLCSDGSADDNVTDYIFPFLLIIAQINIKLGGANHVIRGERDLPKVGRNCMSEY